MVRSDDDSDSEVENISQIQQVRFEWIVIMVGDSMCHINLIKQITCKEDTLDIWFDSIQVLLKKKL